MPEFQFLNKLLAAVGRHPDAVELAASDEHHLKPGTIRRVRTPEGAAFYGVPIGTPIKAAKATRSAIKAAKNDAGFIDGNGKLKPEFAKPVTVTVGGIKQSYPVGSIVYHGKKFDSNTAPEKLIRTPDGDWFRQSDKGVIIVGPKVSDALDDTVDPSTKNGNLVKDETLAAEEGPDLSDWLPPDSPDLPDAPDDEEDPGDEQVDVPDTNPIPSEAHQNAPDAAVEEPASTPAPEEPAAQPSTTPATPAESTPAPADSSSAPSTTPESSTVAPEADVAAPAEGDFLDETPLPFGGVQATPTQMIKAYEALEDSYVHNAGSGAVNQIGPAIKKRDPENPLVGMDTAKVMQEWNDLTGDPVKKKQAVIESMANVLDGLDLTPEQSKTYEKARKSFLSKTAVDESTKGIIRSGDTEGAVAIEGHHYKPGKYTRAGTDAKVHMKLHSDGTATYHDKSGTATKISTSTFAKHYKKGIKKYQPHAAGEDQGKANAKPLEEPQTPGTPSEPSAAAPKPESQPSESTPTPKESAPATPKEEPSAVAPKEATPAAPTSSQEPPPSKPSTATTASKKVATFGSINASYDGKVDNKWATFARVKNADGSIATPDNYDNTWGNDYSKYMNEEGWFHVGFSKQDDPNKAAAAAKGTNPYYAQYTAKPLMAEGETYKGPPAPIVHGSGFTGAGAKFKAKEAAEEAKQVLKLGVMGKKPVYVQGKLMQGGVPDEPGTWYHHKDKDMDTGSALVFETDGDDVYVASAKHGSVTKWTKPESLQSFQDKKSAGDFVAAGTTPEEAHDDPIVNAPPLPETPKQVHIGEAHEVPAQYNANGYNVLPKNKQGASGDGYAAPSLWGKFGAAGVLLQHTDEEGTKRYLLVQRGPGVSSNKGKWQLPGGAINEHESDQEGAARELMEELQAPEGFLAGVTHLGEHKFEHASGWHYNNLAATTPNMFDPTVDGTETGDAKWFTEEQMAELDLVPAFKSSLPKVMEKFSKHNETKQNLSTPKAKEVSKADVDGDLPKGIPGEALDVPEGEAPIYVSGEEIASVKLGTGKLYHGNNVDPESAKLKYWVVTAEGNDGMYPGEVYKINLYDPGPVKLEDPAADVIKQQAAEGKLTEEKLSGNHAPDVVAAPHTPAADLDPETTVDAFFKDIPMGKVPANANFYALHSPTDGKLLGYYAKDTNNNIWEIDDSLYPDGEYKGAQLIFDQDEFNDVNDQIAAVHSGTNNKMWSKLDGPPTKDNQAADQPAPEAVQELQSMIDGFQEVPHIPDFSDDTPAESPKKPVNFNGEMKGLVSANSTIYAHDTGPVKFVHDHDTDKWYQVDGAGVNQNPAAPKFVTGNPEYKVVSHPTPPGTPADFGGDHTVAPALDEMQKTFGMQGVTMYGLDNSGNYWYVHGNKVENKLSEDEVDFFEHEMLGKAEHPVKELPGTSGVPEGYKLHVNLETKTVDVAEKDGVFYNVSDDGNGKLKVAENPLGPTFQKQVKNGIASNKYMDKNTYDDLVGKIQQGGPAEEEPYLATKWHAAVGSGVFGNDQNGEFWYLNSDDSLKKKVPADQVSQMEEEIKNGSYYSSTANTHAPVTLFGKTYAHLPKNGTLWHSVAANTDNASPKFWVSQDGEKVKKITSSGVMDVPLDLFESNKDILTEDASWETASTEAKKKDDFNKLLDSDDLTNMFFSLMEPDKAHFIVNGKKFDALPVGGTMWVDQYSLDTSTNFKKYYQVSEGGEEKWYVLNSTNGNGTTPILMDSPELVESIKNGTGGYKVEDQPSMIMADASTLAGKTVPVSILGKKVGDVPAGGILWHSKQHAADVVGVKYYEHPNGIWSVNKHQATKMTDDDAELFFLGSKVGFKPEQGFDNGSGFAQPSGTAPIQVVGDPDAKVPAYIQGKNVGELPPHGKAYYNTSVYSDVPTNPDSYIYEDPQGKLHLVTPDGVALKDDKAFRENFYEQRGNGGLAELDSVYTQPKESKSLAAQHPLDELALNELLNSPQSNVDVPQQLVKDGPDLKLRFDNEDVPGHVPGGGKYYVHKDDLGKVLGDDLKSTMSNPHLYMSPEGKPFLVTKAGIMPLEGTNPVTAAVHGQLKNGDFVEHPDFEQGYSPKFVPVRIKGDIAGYVPAGGKLYHSPTKDPDTAIVKWYMAPDGDFWRVTSQGAKLYEDQAKAHDTVFDSDPDPDTNLSFKEESSFDNGSFDESMKLPVSIKGNKVGVVPFGGQLFYRSGGKSPDEIGKKYYVHPNGSVYSTSENGVLKMSPTDAAAFKEDLKNGDFVPDPTFAAIKEAAPSEAQQAEDSLVPVTIKGQIMGKVKPGGTLYYSTKLDPVATTSPYTGVNDSVSKYYKDPDGVWYDISNERFYQVETTDSFDYASDMAEALQDGSYAVDTNFGSTPQNEVPVEVQGKVVGKVPTGGEMYVPFGSNPAQSNHKLYRKGSQVWVADATGVQKTDIPATLIKDIEADKYELDFTHGTTVSNAAWVPVEFKGKVVGEVPGNGVMFWDSGSSIFPEDDGYVPFEQSSEILYRDPNGKWFEIDADGVFESNASKKHDSNNDQGFYASAPFDSTPKAAAASIGNVTQSGLPSGQYRLATGGDLVIRPDGHIEFRLTPTSKVKYLDAAGVKQAFLNGLVQDKYGTSVPLDGAEDQKFHVFGSEKTYSQQQLKSKLKEFIQASDPLEEILPALTGMKADSKLATDYHKSLGLPSSPEGAKASYISQLNKLLTPSKLTSAPGKPAKIGPFDASEEGHAKDPIPPYIVDGAVAAPSMSLAVDNRRKLLNMLHEKTGGAIGNNADTMDKYDLDTWVKAYNKGDMRSLWVLESQDSETGVIPEGKFPQHPGADGNEATHQVYFQPEVAGEMPVGQRPEGFDHLDTGWDVTLSDVDKYLSAANVTVAEHMTKEERTDWVKAHVDRNRAKVDMISYNAKTRKDLGDPPLTLALGNGATNPSSNVYQPLVEKGVPPELWSKKAIDQFLADKDLDQQAAGLDAYHKMALIEALTRDAALSEEDKKQKAWADPEGLQLKDGGTSGLVFGNNTAVRILTDQFGDSHVFKPPLKPSEAFRTGLEHEMNLLARKFGFSTPDSKIVTFNGTKGQLQRKLGPSTDLTQSQDYSKLTQQQRRDVAMEHLLDWMLENDDTRSSNMKLMDAGGAIGIDKGRSWAQNGKWDALRPDVTGVHGVSLLYSKLYSDIQNGSVSLEDAEDIYRAVSLRAQAMQQVPDEAVREHFERAFLDRPNTGVSKEKLIEQAVARKNSLADDMDTLWKKVFKNAGMTLPKRPSATLKNNQGHTLHTGFTPDYFERVKANKFHGKTTFFAGTDLEDMAMLMWTEKKDNKDIVHGELKVRKPKFDQVRDFLKSRVSGGGGSEADLVKKLPNQDTYHEMVRKAHRTVEYHMGLGDTKFNQDTLTAAWDLRTKLNKEIEDVQEMKNGTAWAALSAEKRHDYDQTIAMNMQYVAGINEVERAIAASEVPADFAKKQFVYEPPKVAATPKPKVESFKVVKESAHRFMSKGGYSDTSIDDDGNVHTTSNKLEGSYMGQQGQQYTAILPTGERIEFRGGNDTNTRASQQGMMRFVIPDNENLDQSMTRIRAALDEMGLPLSEAEPDDYELFYWRHLYAIMKERKDSKTTTTGAYAPVHKAVKDALIDKGGSAEVEMWRNAFSKFPDTNRQHIDDFVKSGGHLPQFSHFDLRNPNEANSLPYWNRFDITDEMVKLRQAPSATSSGAVATAKTGGAYTTESRIRQFGAWLGGSSSEADQGTGGANFLFTRQNQQDSSKQIYFEPHVLKRTSNFAFNGDNYGSITKRANNSYFDFDSFTGKADGTNEMMIKNAASIMDDISFIRFSSEAQRQEVLKFYKSLGITEIRGVSIEDRFITGDLTSELKAKLGLDKAKHHNSNLSSSYGSQAPTSW